MSFAHLCAILVVEPYNLSIDEIGDLTEDQLVDIYFRRRDEETGEPWTDAEIERYENEPEDVIPLRADLVGYKAVFWNIWADARGLPEEEVKELWVEYLRKNPEEAKDYPEDLKDA